MNQIYPKALQKFLESYANADGPATDSELKLIPVGEDYVWSAAHETLADLGDNVLSGPLEIGGVTFTNGIIKGNNLVNILREVTESIPVQAFVLYFENATDTLLVGFLDTSSNGGLPAVLGSNSFNVTWNAQGILRI